MIHTQSKNSAAKPMKAGILLSFDVEVYRDSVTIDLGTLTNDKVEIATTALDQESGSQMAKPDDKVTIVDTVEFEGLKKGVEYKVIGTLMNKETGEALEINGEPVTSETTFTAKKSTGSVEVEFTFDATGPGGNHSGLFRGTVAGRLKTCCSR